MQVTLLDKVIRIAEGQSDYFISILKLNLFSNYGV
jgi:hypothetical protein